MVWLKYNKISNTDGIVTWINFVPYDKIHGVPSEEISKGVFVESIPQLDDTKNNMGHELHINTTTLALTWVYSDIPQERLPAEIRLTTLEQHAADTDYILMINNLIQ